MAIIGSTVSVTTSAGVVLAAPSPTKNGLGISVLVANTGSAPVYLGGDATVTTSTGFPLNAGSQVSVSMWPGEALYGIVASGTVTVNLLSQGT